MANFQTKWNKWYKFLITEKNRIPCIICAYFYCFPKIVNLAPSIEFIHAESFFVFLLNRIFQSSREISWAFSGGRTHFTAAQNNDFQLQTKSKEEKNLSEFNRYGFNIKQKLSLGKKLIDPENIIYYTAYMSYINPCK